MKKMVLAVSALVIFALSAGFASASCEEACDGPFQTCLKICRQTTQEDSPEAAECVDNCLTGVSGCLKRCKESDQSSENMMRTGNGAYSLNDAVNTEDLKPSAAMTDNGVSRKPVPCSAANAVKPIIIAAGDNPCPGKVYCSYDPCEHCCEWGYFYSTPCDCLCYKSSADASASGCSTYFRCN